MNADTKIKVLLGVGWPILYIAVISALLTILGALIMLAGVAFNFTPFFTVWQLIFVCAMSFSSYSLAAFIKRAAEYVCETDR